MQSHVLRAVIGAVIVFASTSALIAQQTIEKQQAFIKLIAEGFEIRAVTVAPHDSGKNQASQVIYITLQRSKDIAVCSFAHSNWSNMDDDTLKTARLCDVRSYK